MIKLHLGAIKYGGSIDTDAIVNIIKRKYAATAKLISIPSMLINDWLFGIM